LFILVLFFALFEAFDYGVQRFVIFPSFLAVEKNEAQMDISRCTESLRRECHHLDRLCQDWAAWDDAYKFAVDKNMGFVESALPRETFKESRLNLVYFLDFKGQVVWGEIRDTKNFQPARNDSIEKDFLLQKLSRRFIEKGNEASSGILMTKEGPMLVAVKEVLTSKHEGPAHGILIMGKYLGNDIVTILKEQTCVEFKLWPIPDTKFTGNEQAAFSLISDTNSVHINTENKGTLSVYTRLHDIFGNPALLMRADIPRRIVATGNAAKNFALVSIFAAGLCGSLIMLFFLQRFFNGPMIRLTNHVIAIAGSNNLSLRIPLVYTGEIGTLAREFNNMLQQLSHARQKLLEQSYYTGLAEMAGGTLHQIHEIMVPLLVQIDSLRKELPEPNNQEETQHLDQIVSQARIIHGLVAGHDQYCQADRLVENLPLEGLIRESTDLVPDHLMQSLSVEMDFDPQKTPTIKGYRMLILQIFPNLFINAAESVREAELSRGKMNIAVDFVQEEGKDMVHIKFMDNGKGIAPDLLQRIFENGFSTKTNHAQNPFFGLHWCAKVLAVIDGRIYAESEGPNHGACFHILLPAGPIVSTQDQKELGLTEIID
jgi:sensor domain CHASE-containing protein/nitrogen-specific signal transduction histidine kinase